MQTQVQIRWRRWVIVVWYLWQEFCSVPFTAPIYIPPKIKGQRRNCQECVSDLFSAQHRGVPRIVWHGRVISSCPGYNWQTPVLYPSLRLQVQSRRIPNYGNRICGWYKQGEFGIYIRSIVQAGLASAWNGIHIESEGQVLVQVLRNLMYWTHLDNQ